MLEENLQKIIELRHSAPYAVLGPHYSESDRALTIRAFLPGVARAWIVPADGAVQREMQRLHPDGLFALRLPGIRQLDYQLRIANPTGQIATCPDPYAIHEPTFTAADGQALRQGTLADLYNRLGARAETQQGQPGINFTLWAPNASRVSVVGTFNQWDGRRHPLERHESGVWEIFIPGLGLGELYKYEIRNGEGAVFLKTDPLAFKTETYPKTTAFTGDLAHRHAWADAEWQARALEQPGWNLPVAIHRVTLNATCGYGQLRDQVLPTLVERHCTHIELSFWSPDETVASYFTPNPRYGQPEELMAFIDACHQRNIGVILDWIPPVIPAEGQELSWFDGTRIYDADVPGQPGLLAFDLGRPEVRNFLIANARFWQQVYHVDALRTDVRTYAARLEQEPQAAGLRFLLRDEAAPPTLSVADSATLIQGRHGNPHTLLGPHPLPEPGLSVVRALLPGAENPVLVSADQPQLLYPLQPTHDGLFEAIVAADPNTLRYRINATEGGHNHTFVDPYALRFSILSDQDCHLFAEGNHYQIYQNLGAHPCQTDGLRGINFAVWAPNAQRVSVVGTFNQWDGRRHPMRLRPGSGVWELFIPELNEGELYKFEILARNGNIFLVLRGFLWSRI